MHIQDKGDTITDFGPFGTPLEAREHEVGHLLGLHHLGVAEGGAVGPSEWKYVSVRPDADTLDPTGFGDGSVRGLGSSFDLF